MRHSPSFAALLALLACESKKPAEPAKPAEAPAKVEPAKPTAAATAALQRFLPSVAGSPGMVDQVADAMLANAGLAARAKAASADLDMVAGAIQEAGLPEVFAAVPLAESGMDGAAVSKFCSAGPWQFMPETAVRFGLSVKDCTITGATSPFSPEATDTFTIADRPYIQNGACAITACAVDERKDLALATKAAVALLKDALEDPTLAGHAQKDALAILSYNAGKRGVLDWLPTRSADAFADMGAVAASDPRWAEPAAYVPRVVAAAAYAFCRAEANAADAICAGLPGRGDVASP